MSDFRQPFGGVPYGKSIHRGERVEVGDDGTHTVRALQRVVEVEYPVWRSLCIPTEMVVYLCITLIFPRGITPTER